MGAGIGGILLNCAREITSGIRVLSGTFLIQGQVDQNIRDIG